jgi:hypothetical protein
MRTDTSIMHSVNLNFVMWRIHNNHIHTDYLEGLGVDGRIILKCF